MASGPAGRLSHPPRAEEHLLPLHVVAGEGRFTVRLEGIPEADMDKFEQVVAEHAQRMARGALHHWGLQTLTVRRS